MVDVTFQPTASAEAKSAIRSVRRGTSLKSTLKRKSTVAFLMTLPLILLIVVLVVYPALYAVHQIGRAHV